MKKSLLLMLTPFICAPLIMGCNKKGTANDDRDPEYNIIFNDKTHLDGGDITGGGITFHFDENAVNENPDEGFVQIGPHGALYLQSYVPGLQKVYVKVKRTVDYEGQFFLGESSTPNSVEWFDLYSITSSFIDMTPDRPYFSIHNRGDNVLIIDTVKIKYAAENSEKTMKELIQVEDHEAAYDASNPIKPYELHPIDESLVPENRVLRKIGPEEYKEPGDYIYGYEVYSKTKDGDLGKLLYSSKAHFYVRGTADHKHLAIFHLPDGVEVIPVENHQKVDLSQNPNISSYNWSSIFNDFDTPFYMDRHYYPVFSVIGMPSGKDGDGCYPVTTSYSLLERVIKMPDPVMMDGYKFGGWYLDHELTQAFDPDASYSGNLTLYAKCIETNKNFRKVYYYDYDNTFLNRIDYLYENDEITLAKFSDVASQFKGDKMYEVRMGTNRVAMLRPQGTYPGESQEYAGDKLSYELIRNIAGDIRLIVSKIELFDNGPANYSRFFLDSEQNSVISGYKMPEQYKAGDFVLSGRYIDLKDWEYNYDVYHDPQRCDEFTVTDAVDGYLMDQGSYQSIATYGYGNKAEMHSKPLEGILRHESVLKVNRRAFFNRYGLKGTYFPRNAREFDIESYSNTHFNNYLMLPKSLTKIGQRAFMGSTNIHNVFLPKTLTKVGAGAFSLGDYDETSYAFTNIRYRTVMMDKINFYYEGSESEFAKLDEVTRNEITNNASNIIYNASYNTYYGR